MNRKKFVCKGIKERGTFISRSEIDKIYTRGYQQGAKDIADKIKKYYRCLGSMTNPTIMEYYIDQLLKEISEGE